jgi:hypothetical protein
MYTDRTSVAELIASLQLFTDLVEGESRTVTAQTSHRQYLVTGVRTDEFGDPIIEIEFID